MTYEESIIKDQIIKLKILSYLKSRKVNVVTDRVIKTNKYCRDLLEMKQILEQGGFNVFYDKRILTINDMTLGAMFEDTRNNKLEIIFNI